MTKKLTLKLGWLYPRLMSTYGDRGNILILQKRCKEREIGLSIIEIDEDTKSSAFNDLDLIFAGGAQDLQQKIVMEDLKNEKRELLLEKIAENTPAVFVCGAPQLMGRLYEPALGEVIEGVGIFDIETRHPGPKSPRLIGNIAAKLETKNIPEFIPLSENQSYILGFENHGGRTTLGPSAKPLASVIKGFGNNGKDKTEGVVYKNAIGTYLHGPLFAKNPHLADWFIARGLYEKYREEITLGILDDSLEYKAQTAIARKLGLKL